MKIASLGSSLNKFSKEIKPKRGSCFGKRKKLWSNNSNQSGLSSGEEVKQRLINLRHSFDIITLEGI